MNRSGRGCVLALAMLVSAPAGAVEWDKAQSVTVATSEYRFTPNEFTFQRGVPYRLHLENHGRETHEFTAPAFIKTLRVRNPKVLNADHTEVVLQPGQAKDFYFVPQKPGHFPLACADHDWAGMTGDITVE